MAPGLMKVVIILYSSKTFLWESISFYTLLSARWKSIHHTQRGKKGNSRSKGITTSSSRQLPYADQLLGRYVPGEITAQAEHMKGASRALQTQLQPASTQPLLCPAASAPCNSSGLCAPGFPTHHSGLIPHQAGQSAFHLCIRCLTGCPLESRLPSETMLRHSIQKQGALSHAI